MTIRHNANVLRATLVAVAVGATLMLPFSAQGSTTPEQALEALNVWRAGIGLAPVTQLDAEMSEGCRLHNRYEMLNHVLQHAEAQGNPGYSLQGLAAAKSSVLGGEAPGPREVWGETLYHRVALQNPRLNRTWWAASDGFACMGTTGGFTVEDSEGSFDVPPVQRASGFPSELVAYLDPQPGSEAIPPLGPEGETPDPRDLVPGQPDLIGWIPTAVFDGPWATGTEFDISIASASMAPDGGAPIAIVTETTYEPESVAIIPHSPLQPLTWYTAHATGVLRERDIPPDEFAFDLTWRFRTSDEEVPVFHDDIRICDGRQVTVLGSPGDDVLRGTDGSDVIAGFEGNDLIRGLKGRDLICGGDGRDRIYGDGGADLLRGQRGPDHLFGGGGTDQIAGQGGRDALFGGRAADQLKGGPGQDRLSGGPGRDRYSSGPGKDLLFGTGDVGR
jgi:hypothetical protein